MEQESEQFQETPIESTKKEKKPKEESKLNLEEIAKILTSLAEPIKKFIRGIHGEPPEDDIFNGLIHVQDDRERARLTHQQAKANAYRELLADVGKEWNNGSDEGNPFKIMRTIAIMKNKYSIGGCKGEQWKDAILMVHARQPTVTPISLTTPQIQSAQPQAKKHFWQKKEESKPQIAG